MACRKSTVPCQNYFPMMPWRCLRIRASFEASSAACHIFVFEDKNLLFVDRNQWRRRILKMAIFLYSGFLVVAIVEDVCGPSPTSSICRTTEMTYFAMQWQCFSSLVSSYYCRQSGNPGRQTDWSVRHWGRRWPHRRQDIGCHHELSELGVRGHWQSIWGLRPSSPPKASGMSIQIALF